MAQTFVVQGTVVIDRLTAAPRLNVRTNQLVFVDLGMGAVLALLLLVAGC